MSLFFSTIILIITIVNSFPFSYDFESPYVFQAPILSISTDKNTNFIILFSNGQIVSYNPNFDINWQRSDFSPTTVPNNLKLSTTLLDPQQYKDSNQLIHTINLSMSTFVLWNSRTHAIYVYQSDGTPINTFYAQNRIINLALFTISIPQSTPLTLSIIFQSSKIDVLAPVYINKTIFSFKSLYLDALANAVLISSEQVQTISLISLTYYWLCTFLTGRIRTVKLSITLYLNCYNYLTVLPQATAEYVGSLVMLTAQNLFISEQYVFIQNQILEMNIFENGQFSSSLLDAVFSMRLATSVFDFQNLTVINYPNQALILDGNSSLFFLNDSLSFPNTYNLTTIILSENSFAYEYNKPFAYFLRICPDQLCPTITCSIDNCTYCTIRTDLCNICDLGYTRSPQRTCTLNPCNISNCLYCDSNTTCLQCANNLTLTILNQCVVPLICSPSQIYNQSLNICYQTHCTTINCKYCLIDQTCFICNDDYTLDTSHSCQLIPICNISQLLNKTANICQDNICSQDNCLQCDVDDNCLSCVDNYRLSLIHVCIAVCPNYQRLNFTSNTCYDLRCSDSHCQRCTIDGCLICKTNYILISGNPCVFKSPCADSQTLNLTTNICYNNVCIDPKCLTCRTNQSCLTCVKGWNPYSGPNCTQNICDDPNCFLCETGDICFQCLAAFYLVNSACEKITYSQTAYTFSCAFFDSPDSKQLCQHTLTKSMQSMVGFIKAVITMPYLNQLLTNIGPLIQFNNDYWYYLYHNRNTTNLIYTTLFAQLLTVMNSGKMIPFFINQSAIDDSVFTLLNNAFPTDYTNYTNQKILDIDQTPTQFLSNIEPMLVWNYPLVLLIFLVFKIIARLLLWRLVKRIVPKERKRSDKSIKETVNSVMGKVFMFFRQNCFLELLLLSFVEGNALFLSFYCGTQFRLLFSFQFSDKLNCLICLFFCFVSLLTSLLFYPLIYEFQRKRAKNYIQKKLNTHQSFISEAFQHFLRDFLFGFIQGYFLQDYLILISSLMAIKFLLCLSTIINRNIYKSKIICLLIFLYFFFGCLYDFYLLWTYLFHQQSSLIDGQLHNQLTIVQIGQIIGIVFTTFCQIIVNFIISIHQIGKEILIKLQINNNKKVIPVDNKVIPVDNKPNPTNKVIPVNPVDPPSKPTLIMDTIPIILATQSDSLTKIDNQIQQNIRKVGRIHKQRISNYRNYEQKRWR